MVGSLLTHSSRRGDPDSGWEPGKAKNASVYLRLSASDATWFSALATVQSGPVPGMIPLQWPTSESSRSCLLSCPQPSQVRTLDVSVKEVHRELSFT